MNSLQKSKNFIFTSVLYILSGLLLCIWPTQIRHMLFIMLGVSLLLFGAVHILRFFQDKNASAFFQFDLVTGLIAVILGLFLFFRPNFPDAFIPFALGISILINGFIKLQYAIIMKKNAAPNWKWLLIFAVILSIIGLLLILFPVPLTNLLTILVGVTFILAGISDVVSYFKVKNFLKNFEVRIK